MTVARVGTASFELGTPTAPLDIDHTRGVLELVEVRSELLLTEGEYVCGP